MTDTATNTYYMTDTATNTYYTPRIWYGCLACYNDGRLIGEWFDIDDEDTARESIGEYERTHRARFDSVYGPHEEWFIADHEGLFMSGEPSLSKAFERASTIADVVSELFGQIPPVVAARAIDDDIDPDEYRGSWDVWTLARDFGTEYADDTGLFETVPDGIRSMIESHFDFESYGRDLLHDFATIEHDGTAYVFWYH